MFIQNQILYATEVVLAWDIPDTSLALALTAQANFMAGNDPEEYIGLSLR